MEPEAQDQRKRRETFKEAILNRRMLICVFTGFASGLPLYVLIQLVPGWLRVEGVGLAEIGFFALIGFPYTWKFLWSPFMDRFTLPFLGHRRGWMLVTQLALFVSIGAMGFIKPDLSIWTVAYLAAAIAFFSASQDIVLDAYRRELLPDVELGLGNSIHVQAYRLSGLVPGSLALILADHLPWHTVFMVVALFMGVGLIMTLVIDEAIAEPSPPKTMREAIVEPFREFVQRKGLGAAALILAFLFLYKLGDNMATALQTPFYVDVGFSLTQIGSIAKFASLISAIIGGLAGGVIMIKLGINRALWIFGIVQVVSILGFAVLSEVGANPWVLGVAASQEIPTRHLPQRNLHFLRR
jgi:PAT family beta-lactamase induction signal transducer AmpG